MSAEKRHNRHFTEHSLVSFNRMFMKLVYMFTLQKFSGGHKISDEFEFRPDRTTDFGITCHLVQKKNIFDLVRSIACLALIETL